MSQYRVLRKLGGGSLALYKTLYVAAKIVRNVFATATLAVPLAFLMYFVLSGGLILPQSIENTAIMQYLRATVFPLLASAGKMFASRLVFDGWDFALVVLAILALMVRGLVLMPLEAAEQWAQKRLLRLRIMARKTPLIALTARAPSQRLALLREYAESKKTLLQVKKPLAFYAFDVVVPPNLKLGEDSLLLEHAFTEFRQYVDDILAHHQCWKSAWTPDGAMCAFHDPRAAVKAAQDVLAGLPSFNGIPAMKGKIGVRSGVNFGEVVFPDEKEMIEVTDFVIDVAGHLQKHCGEDALWVTRQVINELVETSGFQPVEEKVDNQEVLEWRAQPLSRAASQ